MNKIFFILTISLSFSTLAGKIISLDTNRGASQKFYLMKHKSAIASVILFVGGKGKLKLHKGKRKLLKMNNFLARSRMLFKRQKFNVAVIDAPTDQQGVEGMFHGFRATKDHAEDIALVVDYLKLKFNKPVWLVGTSRGTESVANAAIRLMNKIDGIILTASMTEENRKGTSLPEMKLKKIKVPVQVITHKEDACHVTTPRGSKNLIKKFSQSIKTELQVVSGGDEPISKPCKAKSAHGFLGIERKVVKLIAIFILSH